VLNGEDQVAHKWLAAGNMVIKCCRKEIRDEENDAPGVEDV